jgi:hypothetical protein
MRVRPLDLFQLWVECHPRGQGCQGAEFIVPLNPHSDLYCLRPLGDILISGMLTVSPARSVIKGIL